MINAPLAVELHEALEGVLGEPVAGLGVEEIEGVGGIGADDGDGGLIGIGGLGDGGIDAGGDVERVSEVVGKGEGVIEPEVGGFKDGGLIVLGVEAIEGGVESGALGAFLFCEEAGGEADRFEGIGFMVRSGALLGVTNEGGEGLGGGLGQETAVEVSEVPAGTDQEDLATWFQQGAGRLVALGDFVHEVFGGGVFFGDEVIEDNEVVVGTDFGGFQARGVDVGFGVGGLSGADHDGGLVPDASLWVHFPGAVEGAEGGVGFEAQEVVLDVSEEGFGSRDGVGVDQDSGGGIGVTGQGPETVADGDDAGFKGVAGHEDQLDVGGVVLEIVAELVVGGEEIMVAENVVAEGAQILRVFEEGEGFVLEVHRALLLTGGADGGWCRRFGNFWCARGGVVKRIV